MRKRISQCQIQQGAAVTEFVGSLPTKAPTFSGDVLGDVLMCTCKQNRQAVLIRLFQMTDQVCYPFGLSVYDYDIRIIVQANS